MPATKQRGTATKQDSPFLALNPIGPVPINLITLIPAIDFDSFAFGGNIVPWSPLAPQAPEQPEADSAPASPAQPDSPVPDEDEDGAVAPPAAGPAAASPAPAESGAKPSSLGLRAAQIARQEVGVTEQPKGSNRGPRVDIYQGGKGQFWCCHFVSWCVEQAGQSPFGHLASVAALREWAQGHRAYIRAATAEPLTGDIFTMARTDRAGRVVGGHTGFVISYDPAAKRMKTVEGNISDRVAERMRTTAEVDGYVRI